MMRNSDYGWLRLASFYAKENTGCCKVAVGSAIVSKYGKLISLGANVAYPNTCKGNKGCLRVEKYGDNAKTHRNPDDCRALHSEINAITNAQVDLSEATIYVTRYPCEACARAIVSAGISTVVYGRGQQISEETGRIFYNAEVEVVWRYEFEEEDVLT